MKHLYNYTIVFFFAVFLLWTWNMYVLNIYLPFTWEKYMLERNTKIIILKENIAHPQAKMTNFSDAQNWALMTQQLYLKSEMSYFNFTSDITNLAPVKGGRPIRSAVVTTWRSGSTFLGSILNSHPAMLYHYEPLMHMFSQQVRNPPLSAPSLKYIQELFRCNYSDEWSLNKYSWKTLHTYVRNPYIWKYCQDYNRSCSGEQFSKLNLNSDGIFCLPETWNMCQDPKFLSSMCELFPFQAMKLTHLSLRLTHHLLEDAELNIKLIYLVRDPRATMRSRMAPQEWKWCALHDDCFNPATLCSDLAHDYFTAKELRKKYPGRIMVIRYEDLAADIDAFVPKIFRFLGLSYTAKTLKFLDTHTKENEGGAYSGRRKTSETPFRWVQAWAGNFSTVESIQNHASCNEALKLWGYKLAHSQDELQNNFNPLLSPPWPDMKL